MTINKTNSNWKKDFYSQFTTQVRINKIPQDIDTVLLTGTPIKLEQWFAQTLSTEISKAVEEEKERINKELINTPFIIDSLSVEQQYEVSKYFGEVVESVL